MSYFNRENAPLKNRSSPSLLLFFCCIVFSQHFSGVIPPIFFSVVHKVFGPLFTKDETVKNVQFYRSQFTL